MVEPAGEVDSPTGMNCVRVPATNNQTEGGKPMSWIREDDANLPNIMKVISILPKARQAVQDVNAALMFGGSTLTRVQEESIAATVSVINKCHY